MPDSTQSSAPVAWLLGPSAVEPRPDSRLEIWGLSPGERLRRALRNAGCPRVEPTDMDGAIPAETDRALLFRTDAIYDERLVQGLLAAQDCVLIAPPTENWGGPLAANVTGARFAEAREMLDQAAGAGPGPVPPGLRVVEPAELAPAYTAALRKAAPPYLLPARADQLSQIEKLTFDASYKGLTDLVTKWVWPRPAFAVTRRLAGAGIHPNAVTLVSWMLAVLAFILFWKGAFGAGLVAAWLMTFLDTVDGKLARVTLTSSRFGHVFDHSLDLIHPPFWWFAWGVGLGSGHEIAIWIVVGGYLAGRLLEGLFLLAFRFETHCWRPIDGLFRTITARRNPNLILFSVGALGGRPDLGLVMVAIWTVVSMGFHVVRLAQAAAARWRGEIVEPWDGRLMTELPGGESRPVEDGSTA